MLVIITPDRGAGKQSSESWTTGNCWQTITKQKHLLHPGLLEPDSSLFPLSRRGSVVGWETWIRQKSAFHDSDGEETNQAAVNTCQKGLGVGCGHINLVFLSFRVMTQSPFNEVSGSVPCLKICKWSLQKVYKSTLFLILYLLGWLKKCQLYMRMLMICLPFVLNISNMNPDLPSNFS